MADEREKILNILKRIKNSDHIDFSCKLEPGEDCDECRCVCNQTLASQAIRLLLEMDNRDRKERILI